MPPKHEGEFEGAWWRFPVMRDALLSGGVVAITWTLAHVAGFRWLEPFGYVLAIPVGANHFFREGIAELWTEKQVGIEILMSAAAVGAAILGLWDEAAILVVLYATAEALEEYAYARTRSAIRALLDLAPKEAHLLREGKEETVPASKLRPGDVFIVKPGEAIPTDGVVREGASAVDESSVTGESMPVEKVAGALVLAGAVNKQGALLVEATTTFEDNTLSKIIHLVEEAQEQKGRLQRFFERFGRRYSPAVLVAAALLLLVPPLFGQPFLPWALRAVVLLVAAAPCALVMSTPVAAAAGIGIAGRNGVLIKGGIHLENLGRVRIVAFDKTGTLTEGTPEVTDVIPVAGVAPQMLLRLAASAECRSEHPIGNAVVQRASDDNVTLGPVTDFEALAGLGARARIDGQVVFVGSPALFRKQNILLDKVRPVMDQLQAQGKTVIAAGTDRTLLGLLALRDRIRPGAREAIEALHRAGIKVVMLTGDNERTAAAIARELGIDRFHAELKPDDKVQHIKLLEEKEGVVAMVGDGINDAPALAASSVGIAMGVAGTDAAIEAADVALMSDDLRKLIYAIRLGRVAQAITAQNILLSLLTLGVLIPSALVGAITVVTAVIAHELTELIAVANGLRVARYRAAEDAGMTQARGKLLVLILAGAGLLFAGGIGGGPPHHVALDARAAYVAVGPSSLVVVDVRTRNCCSDTFWKGSPRCCHSIKWR